jgi:molecular chaperone DnaK (HSP70)
VTPEQIDEVVLVGGSTRIPLVRSAVEVLFRARRTPS